LRLYFMHRSQDRSKASFYLVMIQSSSLALIVARVMTSLISRIVCICARLLTGVDHDVRREFQAQLVTWQWSVYENLVFPDHLQVAFDMGECIASAISETCVESFRTVRVAAS